MGDSQHPDDFQPTVESCRRVSCFIPHLHQHCYGTKQRVYKTPVGSTIWPLLVLTLHIRSLIAATSLCSLLGSSRLFFVLRRQYRIQQQLKKERTDWVTSDQSDTLSLLFICQFAAWVMSELWMSQGMLVSTSASVLTSLTITSSTLRPFTTLLRWVLLKGWNEKLLAIQTFHLN